MTSVFPLVYLENSRTQEISSVMAVLLLAQLAKQQLQHVYHVYQELIFMEHLVYLHAQ